MLRMIIDYDYKIVAFNTFTNYIQQGAFCKSMGTELHFTITVTS